MRRLVMLVVVAACGTSPGLVTPQTTPIPDPPPPPPTDTSATALWIGVSGSVPRLDGETIEALALAPASPWGRVTLGFLDSVNDRYVVRSGTRGTYHPRIDGAPLAIDDAAAHVVKLTMTSTDKFVPQPVNVTSIEVLPVDAVAILDDAAARWTAHLAEQRGAIDATLAETDRLSGGRPLGPEATHTMDGFGPTWLPGTHELQVIYVRKIMRSSTMIERFGESSCGKYLHGKGGGGQASFPDERGERIACPEPFHEVRRHVRAYSIDVGLVLRYGADGKLVSARPYAPHPVPGTGPY